MNGGVWCQSVVLYQMTTNGKRVRLVDIAQAAGVSVGVVSQVLGSGKSNSRASETTASKIKEIAAALNYSPNHSARRLRGARSNLYGVLVASAGDPLVSFLVQYLDMEALKVGCRTLICNTIGDTALAPDQFNYHVDELINQGVDGVLCAVHDWFGGNRKALIRKHPNTVFYGDPRIPTASYVSVDREASATLAVRHLVERGYKRIAIALRGSGNLKQSARLLGYRKAMVAVGRKVEERLIFKGDGLEMAIPMCDAQGERWELPPGIGARVVEALVARGRADAIIAPDDFWASVIIRYLREINLRVPQDVAVIGYLNHYLAEWIDPPLTTISRCPDLAARNMVLLLERLIAGTTMDIAERRVVITPKLIVRAST